MKNKKMKVFIADWIIGIIVTIVCCVGTIAYTEWKSRCNSNALNEPVEATMTFTNKTDQYSGVKTEPCKGDLCFAWRQKSGKKNSDTKYTLSYKKDGQKAYMLSWYLTAGSKSTDWDGKYKIVSCNGYTDYWIRVARTSNQDTKSKLLLDLAVTN